MAIKQPPGVTQKSPQTGKGQVTISPSRPTPAVHTPKTGK